MNTEAFEAFESLCNRAHDAQRELAALLAARSAFSPPVDASRVSSIASRFDEAARSARGMGSAIGGREDVSEMLSSLSVAEQRVRHDVRVLSTVDRGHAGLACVVVVGETTLDVGVSATLSGGLETNAWRIGAAMERAGICLPTSEEVAATLAALSRAGVEILDTWPSLEASSAASRVWAGCVSYSRGRRS